MVGITETVLRDGHQSILATRMRTRHMVPALEMLDAARYRSLEVWGGATFDVCYRFLNEDPWERLRILKKGAPNTPLQMLLRGQNLVGYRHYPDDIVERFCTRAAAEGIDIFRIFDALNDPRNMETAIRAVRRTGKVAQATICYTESPVHTLDAFVALGKRLKELGAGELCVKDMGGFMPPEAAARLVSALKKEVGLPVAVHTHSTSGMALMTLHRVIEAGADSVDTAISPFSGGTSQPPTESIVAALEGTPWRTKLSVHQLSEIASYFGGVLDHYRGLLDLKSLQVDPQVLLHQVPGGMLSNLFSQLKEQGAMDRLREVLAEVPRVREDLGYPPLVTPTSQIVGTQAVLNVMLNERYKVITEEVRNYVKGLYGEPPGSISDRLSAKVLEGKVRTTVRPADLLAPEFEKAFLETTKLGLSGHEDEVLSYALFPSVFREYVSRREQGVDEGTIVAAATGFYLATRASKRPPVGPAQGQPVSPWVQSGRARLSYRRGL